MMNKTLYIVRGLPGSGKSTLAKKLCPRDAYEADDWFVDHDGIYKFDPSQLSKAHHYCQTVVENAMQSGSDQIAVSNTFSQLWEIKPYQSLARKYEYNVTIIECQNDFGSIHNVPGDAIDKMKARWEAIE